MSSSVVVRFAISNSIPFQGGGGTARLGILDALKSAFRPRGRRFRFIWLGRPESNPIKGTEPVGHLIVDCILTSRAGLAGCGPASCAPKQAKASACQLGGKRYGGQLSRDPAGCRVKCILSLSLPAILASRQQEFLWKQGASGRKAWRKARISGPLHPGHPSERSPLVWPAPVEGSPMASG